ncbi:MAG: TIGR00269 family protein [Candidatus Korarchaeota archaeon]|nr:TIGR00269 family protein [Candidatus Korarchaeota archaeon]NIU85095.1 TIGR00269 family protein [Candidatus Thorarchaeota archaeon]NIW15022.1 TIGR00269 family protein [Candidatus Thorarchaeota archaeon]NIW53032.1 TIGR00269 family protein [Candidatus Korarchaeota archaeon]
MTEKIYYKKEAGRSFSRKEFLNYLEKKTLETIQKWDMFDRDSKIAVAVSGGKDSTTLIHILDKIEREFPSELFMIHLDEGIQNYSDRSKLIVKETAKNLGVPLYVKSIKERFGVTIDEVATVSAKKRRHSPCAYCGVWRRWLMNHLANKVHADRLVTAHCLDDEAQTILLNVLRGSLTGLLRLKTRPKSIPGVVPHVKPFRSLPEKEITLYAQLKDLDYNDKACPHAEEGMRWGIRQWLYRQEERYPGTYHAILNIGTKISRRLTASDQRKEIRNCEVCGYPASGGALCQAHKFKRRFQELLG